MRIDWRRLLVDIVVSAGGGMFALSALVAFATGDMTWLVLMVPALLIVALGVAIDCGGGNRG